MTRGRKKPPLTERLRPKGFRFSFAGIVMFLFTGTVVFLAIRFPMFKGLIALAVLFALGNLLFFLRFSDRKAPGLVDRMMQSRFFPRKLATSNEGRFLVIISIGIGFAAVNTGSNLLYLLMAMLLAIIIASGILSELALRKLEWFADIPDQAVARTDTVVPIRIANGKRRLASFSIDGEILLPLKTDVEQRLGRILKIEPKGSDWAFPTLVFPHRGRYLLRGIGIGTRYPFSFFRKSRNFETPKEVLVVPRGTDPVPPLLHALSSGHEEHANRSGRGIEFFSVRPMGLGDEWRDVHWKQTARTSRFAVKEFEALASRRIYLVCASDPSAARQDPDALEPGIELAASVARHLSDNAFEVGLSAPRVHLAPAGGKGALRQIFTALALLDLDADWSGPDPSLARHAQRSDILVTVRLDTRHVSLSNGLTPGTEGASGNGLTPGTEGAAGNGLTPGTEGASGEGGNA